MAQRRSVSVGKRAPVDRKRPSPSSSKSSTRTPTAIQIAVVVAICALFFSVGRFSVSLFSDDGSPPVYVQTRSGSAYGGSTASPYRSSSYQTGLSSSYQHQGSSYPQAPAGQQFQLALAARNRFKAQNEFALFPPPNRGRDLLRPILGLHGPNGTKSDIGIQLRELTTTLFDLHCERRYQIARNFRFGKSPPRAFQVADHDYSLRAGDEGAAQQEINPWREAFLRRDYAEVGLAIEATFIVGKRELSHLGLGMICPETQLFNHLPQQEVLLGPVFPLVEKFVERVHLERGRLAGSSVEEFLSRAGIRSLGETAVLASHLEDVRSSWFRGRFYLLVMSTEPLVAYVYDDFFVLRDGAVAAAAGAAGAAAHNSFPLSSEEFVSELVEDVHGAGYELAMQLKLEENAHEDPRSDKEGDAALANEEDSLRRILGRRFLRTYFLPAIQRLCRAALLAAVGRLVPIAGFFSLFLLEVAIDHSLKPKLVWVRSTTEGEFHEKDRRWEGRGPRLEVMKDMLEEVIELGGETLRYRMERRKVGENKENGSHQRKTGAALAKGGENGGGTLRSYLRPVEKKFSLVLDGEAEDLQDFYRIS